VSDFLHFLTALRVPSPGKDKTMSVLGSVLGELEGLDDDVLHGVGEAVHHAITARKHGGGHHIHVKKPAWRSGELAPGVNAPQGGQVPLPLNALSQGGVFSVAAGLGSITFEGKLQKPYRAERLLASTVRVGATAVARCIGQIFVGVDLNQAQLQGVDVEVLGAPTAFDTRMQLMQAPPGVSISILVSLFGPAPTGTDSISLTMFFLGEVIH
jgi:hypothetical protein